jgi:hypothetical protein
MARAKHGAFRAKGPKVSSRMCRRVSGSDVHPMASHRTAFRCILSTGTTSHDRGVVQCNETLTARRRRYRAMAKQNAYPLSIRPPSLPSGLTDKERRLSTPRWMHMHMDRAEDRDGTFVCFHLAASSYRHTVASSHRRIIAFSLWPVNTDGQPGLKAVRRGTVWPALVL